ncbi:hypothetical protein [Nocardioides pelophilus]|uniref:hypothetical protein n=1 Tax=Nocardioides pelophilus TaxID=2172019 RepID=UPI00160414AE|nr:hypothetical protein [Nocardioides pelophilus]
MGSWGTGIFSNDDASDVREGFRDLIAEGVAPAQATQRLVEEYGVGQNGPDDNDFWFGLASTQHRLGHIVPEVIGRAFDLIDDPSELARWEPAQRTRRKAALNKLRDELLQPAPDPKKLRPRRKGTTSLEPGQHVVMPLPGGPVLLRVVRIHEDKSGRAPVVVVVDWDGQQQSLRDAHRLPAVLAPMPLREDEAMGFIVFGEPSDPDEVQVLPQRVDERTPTRRWYAQVVTRWSELGRFFGPDGAPQSP